MAQYKTNGEHSVNRKVMTSRHTCKYLDFNKKLTCSLPKQAVSASSDEGYCSAQPYLKAKFRRGSNQKSGSNKDYSK